jgi:hypothetical protein
LGRKARERERKREREREREREGREGEEERRRHIDGIWALLTGFHGPALFMRRLMESEGSLASSVSLSCA